MTSLTKTTALRTLFLRKNNKDQCSNTKIYEGRKPDLAKQYSYRESSNQKGSQSTLQWVYLDYFYFKATNEATETLVQKKVLS